MACKDIEVAIKDYPGQSFITRKDIVDLLQSTHKIALRKTPLKNIDAYAIDNQLKSHPLVKNVLVYKTWNGTLKICLETKYFIARMIRLMEPNGRQVYLDEKGNWITLEGLPLLRLLVITGKNIVTEKKKIDDKGVLRLLHCIYEDAFWRRQITSLQVEDSGKIILGTQISGHQIEFGHPENIQEKLNKLALFYSEVIPYKGWKAYHRVNIAFKGQLICE